MVPVSEDRTVLRFLSQSVPIVRFLHNGDGVQKTEDSFVLRNWYRFFPQKIGPRSNFPSAVLLKFSEN